MPILNSHFQVSERKSAFTTETKTKENETSIDERCMTIDKRAFIGFNVVFGVFCVVYWVALLAS